MKVKNYIFIILLMFFTISLIVFNHYKESKSHNIFSNHIASFNNVLSKKLIDNFFSGDTHLKDNSTKLIKKIVLQDLGYKNWMDYIGFIEIYLYPADIIYDNTEDLIVWINLSKDQGTMGIYSLHEDKYIYHSKIDNLSYIKNVSSVKIEALNKVFIITEETIDEMMGAFFTDNYFRIFSENNDTFIEVFRQSTDYTAYFFEGWNTPETIEPRWYKINEFAVIDNIVVEKNHIEINISKSLLKYEAINSTTSYLPKDFKLINQISFDTKMIWSEHYGSFIIAEGKMLQGNIDIGILEDTSQTVDYLLNLTGKYYKVIDKNKNIMYVDPKDIIIIKDFSTL